MEDGVAVTRLMSTDIRTVTPDRSMTDAAERLRSEGIGSLVVVDGENKPIGMLTTTDLATLVSDGAVPTETTVEEYMSDDFVTLRDDNTVRDAAAKMINKGVHHLPVIDETGAIVGMLSTMDLAVHLAYQSATDMT